MPIRDTLFALYSVGEAIYDQVKLVEANHAQCQTLGNRVQTVLKAIKGLKQYPNNHRFKPALRDLHICLQDILGFIQKFSDQHWVIRVLKARGNNDKFKKFNTHLVAITRILNLGLVAQNLVDRRQDQKDQQQDQTFIKSNLQKIIEQNQKVRGELEKFQRQGKAHQLIIQNQLASLKTKLLQIGQGIFPKPLVDSARQIPYYELSFSQKIDKEGLSVVYHGRWCEQDVAIKQLEGNFTDKEFKRFIREVQQLQRLAHANVITYYGACVERTNPCVVLAYMPNHDLQTLIKKQTLSSERQHRIAMTLAQGLYYLHERQVVHGGVTPRHVLIADNYSVRLTGFGISASLATRTQSRWLQSAEALRWMAPECLQDQEPTARSDLYSYGLVLWTLLSGRLPFEKQSVEALRKQILSGDRETLPRHWPEVYRNLIAACWAADPIKRPTPGDVLKQLRAFSPRAPSPSTEDRLQLARTCEKQKNYKAAMEHLTRAEEKGSHCAGTNMAEFFLTGRGGTFNKQRAYALLEKSAAQGQVRAMWNLAQMLEYEKEFKDLPKALQWYKKIIASAKPGYLKKAQERLTRVKEKMQQAQDEIKANEAPKLD